MTIDDLAKRQDRELTWQTAVAQFFNSFVLDQPKAIQDKIGSPGGLILSWDTDQAPQKGEAGTAKSFWWTNKGGRICFNVTVVGLSWGIYVSILPFRLEGPDLQDLTLTVRAQRTVVKRVSSLVLPVEVGYLNRPYSGTAPKYVCLWSGSGDNMKIADAIQNFLGGTIPESEFRTTHWWT